MTEPQPSDELSAAVRAVQAACRVCWAVARGEGGITHVTKPDDSPVTVADFAAQAVVVHFLQAELGPVSMAGEESAAILYEQPHLRDAVVAAARVAWPEARAVDVLAAIDDGAEQGDHSTYWALDPIDGTKGFLRRGQYAVCLARVRGSTPDLGVLGCPNLPVSRQASLATEDPAGSIYAAEAGSQAFESTVDPLALRALDTTVAELPTELIVTHSVESGHTRIDQVAAILRELGRSFGSLACDSQAKYALVARGQAHAYIRVPTQPGRVEMVWDHAAGAAIAQACGMRVTDLRGYPFDFSSPAGLTRNYGILCAHPALHADLVRAIARTVQLPGPARP